MTTKIIESFEQVILNVEPKTFNVTFNLNFIRHKNGFWNSIFFFNWFNMNLN